MKYLMISSVSVGGVVVGGVVAVVACVVVCLNRVGVSVGACVRSGVRRRIARCLSSIVVRSGVVGMVSRGVVPRIVVMLAVRGMLMVRELTCSDIGHSRSIARIDRATNACEEWTPGWSSAGGCSQGEAEGKE